jgi:hypothetical protein
MEPALTVPIAFGIVVLNYELLRSSVFRWVNIRVFMVFNYLKLLERFQMGQYPGF